MSELIPTAVGATGWFDFTVTSGSPKALFLKGAVDGQPAPAGVDFVLAHKTPAATYHPIATLNAGNIGTLGSVGAAGTYGVQRVAGGSAACGMDVEG